MSSFPSHLPLGPLQVSQPRQLASKLPLTRWAALRGHFPEQKQLLLLPELTRIFGPLQNPLLLLLVNLDLLLLLTVIANKKML